MSTDPTPAGTANADQPAGPEVGGEVRLMTDEPVVWDGEDESGSRRIVVEACRVMAARPWLVPTVLVGLVAVVVILRRRS